MKLEKTQRNIGDKRKLYSVNTSYAFNAGVVNTLRYIIVLKLVRIIKCNIIVKYTNIYIYSRYISI